MLYIYCPHNKEELVESILAKLNISYNLNVEDQNVSFTKYDHVCHFMSTKLSDNVRNLLIKAIKYGAKVLPLSEYLSNKLGYIELDLLHHDYFLHHKSFSILSKKRNSVLKRILDLLVVFMLLPIAIPVGLLTAIAIKLESKGGILFKQARVGRYNQKFEIIKFRSMTIDAEKNGAQFATKNDMRVTKVGKFIRKTRIDELPQLINVLKGEMSVVGPRPEREVFIKELEKDIPYYRFRHATHVGITGLAQIKYPYGENLEDAKWKHKYDVHYIKNQSLLLDLKILLLTIKVIIFGMGQ